MTRVNCSSIRCVSRAAAAALIAVACIQPAVAQDMLRGRPSDVGSRDRAFGEGGRGNRGMGAGLGIGIGIGILQGLTMPPSAPPAGQNTPSKGTNASHKTDSKAMKRAAKKDDKTPPTPPKQQITEKPPPIPPSPSPTTTTNGTPETPTSGTPITTSNPPSSNTPSTADNPPSNTPNPVQPIAPRDQPTTKKAEDCPQRGRGCIALLIDFGKYAWTNGTSDAPEPPLDDIAEALRSDNRGFMKCDVDRVDPDIKRTVSWTRKYYLGTAEHSIDVWTSQTDPDGTEQKHNEEQMQKIDAAVNKHRIKIESFQPETAIEMVSAHGSAIGEFGRWSPRLESAKNNIPRGSFHSGNYDAAKDNVCGWLVYDDSCFSGLTTKAVDILNNTGKANFSYQPSDSCPLHAGYEADIAVGTATEKTCTNGSYAGQSRLEHFIVNLVSTSIVNKAPVPAQTLAFFLDGGNYPSTYADNGYHYCGKPERKGMLYSKSPPPSSSSSSSSSSPAPAPQPR
jgi:hypothetical protein